MTQAIKILDVATQLPANANPVSLITGYNKTSATGTALTSSSQWSALFGQFALWYDETLMLGDTVKSTIKLGTKVFADARLSGASVVNLSGQGYTAALADVANTVTLYTNSTGGWIGSTALFTSAYTVTTDKFLSIVNHPTTGLVEIYDGATKLGEYAGEPNDYRYAGMYSKAGRIKQLISEYTLPYSIISVDGDNSIEIGQTGFTIITSGFTGQPVATTDNANITVTITGGSSNTWTASVSNRSEGATSPALPVSFNLTLTNGAETGTITVTFTKKSTETLITFVNPVTDNNKFLGYWFNSAGHTVDGARFWYVPFGDLVVNSDSACLTTNAVMFTGWLQPTAGATAGKVYEFTVTVNESGVVAGITFKQPSLGLGFGVGI